MTPQTAGALLRELEQQAVARKGEQAVEAERVPAPGSDVPEPVLLLTDTALYARAAGTWGWSRLPLHRIRRVDVTSDDSGLLTRYRVVDDQGQVRVDVALPMARGSFRAHMESLAVQVALAPAPTKPTVTVARARVRPSATCWRAA